MKKAILALAIAGTLAITGNVYAGSFPEGWCTYGVDQLKGRKIPWSGDAKDWYKNAQAQGYNVGKEPRKGAIVVFSGETYGHVGVITNLSPLTMIDMNGGGAQCGTVSNSKCSKTFNKFVESPVSQTSSKLAILGYIYFDEGRPMKSLSLACPSSVNENSSKAGNCTAKLYYANGANKGVNPSWGDNSSYLSITSKGAISTTNVSKDTNVNIIGAYSEDNYTITGTVPVKIKNK